MIPWRGEGGIEVEEEEGGGGGVGDCGVERVEEVDDVDDGRVEEVEEVEEEEVVCMVCATSWGERPAEARTRETSIRWEASIMSGVSRDAETSPRRRRGVAIPKSAPTQTETRNPEIQDDCSDNPTIRRSG